MSERFDKILYGNQLFIAFLFILEIAWIALNPFVPVHIFVAVTAIGALLLFLMKSEAILNSIYKFRVKARLSIIVDILLMLVIAYYYFVDVLFIPCAEFIIPICMIDFIRCGLIYNKLQNIFGTIV